MAKILTALSQWPALAQTLCLPAHHHDPSLETLPFTPTTANAPKTSVPVSCPTPSACLVLTPSWTNLLTASTRPTTQLLDKTRTLLLLRQFMSTTHLLHPLLLVLSRPLQSSLCPTLMFSMLLLLHHRNTSVLLHHLLMLLPPRLLSTNNSLLLLVTPLTTLATMVCKLLLLMPAVYLSWVFVLFPRITLTTTLNNVPTVSAHSTRNTSTTASQTLKDSTRTSTRPTFMPTTAPTCTRLLKLLSPNPWLAVP